jgi:hypothetical protein
MSLVSWYERLSWSINRILAELHIPVDHQLLFLCRRLFPTGGTILNAVMTPWVRGRLFWMGDLRGASVCMAELMSANLWEYRGWVVSLCNRLFWLSEQTQHLNTCTLFSSATCFGRVCNAGLYDETVFLEMEPASCIRATVCGTCFIWSISSFLLCSRRVLNRYYRSGLCPVPLNFTKLQLDPFSNINFNMMNPSRLTAPK